MTIVCDKANTCLNHGKRCENCGAMSDIYNHYPYYKTRAHLDRDTSLIVLNDISSTAYPDHNLFGVPVLSIRRSDFEAIRKKYLD